MEWMFSCAIRKQILQHIIGISKGYNSISALCRTNNVIRTKTTAINSAYRIYGPSPTPRCVPVFILHDCLGSKKNWEHICKHLAVITDKTFIAVDARNHGDSPYCDEHSYSTLAADFSHLIKETFAVNQCIVIGHGMGGRTGIILALTEPSTIESLMVVDISPVSSPCSLPDLPKIIDVMKSVDFKGLDLYQARTAAKNKFLENGLFQNEEEVQLLLQNVRKLSDNSIGWKYNLDTLKKNVDNILAFPDMTGKLYAGPTLFVGGKNSYCIPCDDNTGIHKLFPAAKLIYIDGTGHNIHAEDPNALCTAFMHFLSDYSKLQTST